MKKKGLAYYSVTAIFLIFLFSKGISMVVDANKKPQTDLPEDKFNYSEQDDKIPQSPYYSYLEVSPFGTEQSGQSAADNKTTTESQPKSTNESENKTDTVYELTEEELKDIIVKSFGEDMPIESLSVNLSSDGTAKISAIGNKKELMDYLSNKNVSLPSAVSAAAFLLPQDLELEASLSIGCDPESGLVNVGIDYVKVSDVKVPDSIINSSLTDKANQKINSYITSKNMYFNNITVVDGKIIFDVVPSGSDN